MQHKLAKCVDLMELRKLKDLHFVPIDSPGPALIVHFSKCSPGASVFLTSEIDCDHANDENEGESQFYKATNQFCETIDLCCSIRGKQIQDDRLKDP